MYTLCLCVCLRNVFIFVIIIEGEQYCTGAGFASSRADAAQVSG